MKMGRPAERWPTYALENLEDSLYKLRELEKKASIVEDAIMLGDDLRALRELSDVRVLALECVENLVRSRIGKYKQQQRERKWSRPSADPTAQAVAEVIAIRRP